MSGSASVHEGLVSGAKFTWVARCNCGWRGRGRWRWSVARDDFLAHHEQVARP